MSQWQICECQHLGGKSPDDITEHVDHFDEGDGGGRCTKCNCAKFTRVGDCDRDGCIDDDSLPLYCSKFIT